MAPQSTIPYAFANILTVNNARRACGHGRVLGRAARRYASAWRAQEGLRCSATSASSSGGSKPPAPPAHFSCAHDIVGTSSCMPHGHGTFTFTLYHRNHMRTDLATSHGCHGGVQEGDFHRRIMLFAAVAMRSSRTLACVAAIDHRRALFHVGPPAGALQPLI